VSIILPAFNRLAYLRLAVESVLAQTCRDWELIVADDGSASQTREFLATLDQPPRVRILWRAHSGIPAAVRNAALREARGQYVAFLDSDDTWVPQKLEMQIEALRAQPRCRWSYSAFTQVDAQGAVLEEEARRRWTPHQGPIFEKILRNQAAFRSPSVVLAERELLMQVGGFDEQMPSAEDFDLYVRLALCSEIALVDKPLTCVRVHEENYSGNDLASGLAGRDYALRKLQANPAAARWYTLLRAQRVNTAVGLAATYALMNSRVYVLRTVRDSFPYGWSDLHWWCGVSKACIRTLAPSRVIELRHRLRAASAAPTAAVRSKPE
jgi:glycosyltransferase involved in cell wall biosynthesis